MAITARGKVGGAYNASASTTVTVASSATIPAGTLLFLVLGYDNAANQSTSPTVSCSNLGTAAWTAAFSPPIGQGTSTTAGSGVFIAAFWVIAPSTISSGATLTTVTFGALPGAKTVALVSGFDGVGSTQRSTSYVNGSSTGTTSLPTNTPDPVAGDLVIGFGVVENNAAPTPDTDTTNGDWSSQVSTLSSGGGGTANVSVFLQSKVVTAGGVQTYNAVGSNDIQAGVAVFQPYVPAITQAAYRFYADGTESGSAALAAQDTGYAADTSGGNVNLQIRMRLQSTTSESVSGGEDWRLQWEKNADGNWVNIAGPTADVALAYQPEQTALTLSQPIDNITGTHAQSFKGNGGVLSRVEVCLAKFGSPTDNITAYLYNATGTWASNDVKPNGSSVAAADGNAPASSIPPIGSQTYSNFNFTTDAPQLAAGTVYCAAFASDSPGSSNYVVVYTSSESVAPFPGNRSYFQSGSWQSNATSDLAVRVFATPTNVVGFNSASLTEGAATTNRLTGGSGSFSAGEVSEAGFIVDLGWGANNYTEVVYSVTLKSADLTNGDVLRFRVVRGYSPLTDGMTYSATPTLTIGGGAPTKTPADTAAGADALTVTWTRDRTQGDAAAGADAPTTGQDRSATLGDTAAGADVATPERGTAQAKTPADTAAGADAPPAVVWARGRTPADTAGATDSCNAVLTPGAVGPVAAYAFSEGSGTTTADDTGNGHTGSLVGNISFGTGHTGGGVVTTASPADLTRVNIPRAGLEPSLNLTIMGWAKAGNIAGRGFQPLIEKPRTLNDPSYSLWLNQASSGAPQFFITATTGGGRNITAPSTTMSDGQWHHLAGTYDGTAGEMKLYVDGVLVQTGTSASGALVYDSNDIGILGSPYWTGEASLSASADDIRIFNQTLTLTQIQTWKDTPVGGVPGVDRVENLADTAAAKDGYLSTLTPAPGAGDINVRGWSLTGINKTSSTTLVLSTVSGTDYPQVGDLLIVAYVMDNASSSTPAFALSLSDPRFPDTSVAKANATDASATAGADVIIGYDIKVLSQAFISSTSLTLVSGTAVTAKSGVAIALSGAATSAPTVRQAPTAGSSATLQVLPTAPSWAVGASGVQTNVAPTAPTSGTTGPVTFTATQGAATNVGVRMDYSDTNLQYAAIQDGLWLLEIAAAVVAAGWQEIPTDHGFFFDEISGVAARDRAPADTAGASDDLTVVREVVRTVPDTAAAADSMTADLGALRTENPADAAGATDSVTSGYSQPESVTDTADAGDVASTLAARDRTVTDAAGVGDTLATALAEVRGVSDDAHGSDTLTLGPDTKPRSFADTAAATDSMVTGPDSQDRSAADSAAGADSITVERALGHTIADSAGAVDDLEQSGGRVVDETPIDAAAATDSMLTSQVRSAPLADTAAGADALTFLRVLDRTIADGAGGSDLLTAASETTLADSAGATDSLTATYVVVATLSDTAAGSDTLASAATRDQFIPDIANGGDTCVTQQGRTAPLSDAAAGSDSLSTSFGYAVTLADTAAGSDALTRALDLAPLADAAGATDLLVTGPNVRNLSVTDSAGATDTLIPDRFLPVSLSDTAGASDSLTRTVALVIALTDTADGSDALTEPYSRSRTLADTAAGSDARDISREVTISDAAGGSDSLTETATALVGLADDAQALDSVAVARSSAGTASIAGNADAVDDVTEVRTQVRTISDSAAASDARSAVMTRDIADQAGGADAANTVATRNRSVSDTATGVDDVSAAKGTSGAVADAAGATDALLATHGLTLAIDDSAGATDSLTDLRGGAALIADTAAGSDTVSRVATSDRSFADSAAGADSLTALFQAAQDRTVTDSAGATDAVTVSRAKAVSDLANAVDQILTDSVSSGNLADLGIGDDDLERLFDLGRSTADNGTALDTLIEQWIPADAGEPVFEVDVVLRPYAGNVRVVSDTPVRAIVGSDRILVKVGSDG